MSFIQGSRVALRNLYSKQHRVDEEALKQQELLYMQDLQLQQLEHKYNRMEGERTEDELVILNNKIKVNRIHDTCTCIHVHVRIHVHVQYNGGLFYIIFFNNIFYYMWWHCRCCCYYYYHCCCYYYYYHCCYC